MVHNYKYLRIIIDRTLTFTCHLAETKLQIQHDQGHHKSEDKSQHQNVHDSKQVFDTVCYIIRCSLTFISLRLSLIVLRKNTKIIPLLFIFGLPNDTSSILVRENQESFPSAF